MFGKDKNDKIREWNNLIDRYISLHKYIKDVGKIGITQSRSGGITTEVQLKIKEAITQTDKTLQQLKCLFKPCLTEVDISDIFPEEKLKAEIENLNKKVADLTQEKYLLQQKLSENPGDVRILHIEKECEMLLQDKKLLQEQVVQLEDHCKFLTKQVQDLITRKSSEGSKNEALENQMQIFYLNRQQQLEETLKVQNDLIYDLKKQLESTTLEKENLKSLNNKLDSEFQKKGHFQFKHIDEENNDYNNQRIDEYNLNADSKDELPKKSHFQIKDEENKGAKTLEIDESNSSKSNNEPHEKDNFKLDYHIETVKDKDIKNELDYDYSNRSTLRIGEYNFEDDLYRKDHFQFEGDRIQRQQSITHGLHNQNDLNTEEHAIFPRNLRDLQNAQELKENLSKTTITSENEKMVEHANDLQTHVACGESIKENWSETKEYERIIKEEDKPVQDNKHDNEPQMVC